MTHRPRSSLWLVTLCALALAASCASTSPKKKKTKKLPPPPSGEVSELSETDAHFADVRRAASEQLECPEDQIIVQCTQRDRGNNCIAVRASGCDKQFEYQFGTE